MVATTSSSPEPTTDEAMSPRVLVPSGYTSAAPSAVASNVNSGITTEGSKRTLPSVAEMRMRAASLGAAIHRRITLARSSSSRSSNEVLPSFVTACTDISLADRIGSHQTSARTLVRRFRHERRQEALHLYHRVHVFAYAIMVSGLLLGITGMVVKVFLPKQVDLLVVKIFRWAAYATLTSGILVFSTCDPVDTNIDTVMRVRPVLRVGMSTLVLVALTLSAVGYGHILNLLALPAPIFTLVKAKPMAAIVHLLSILLLSHLIQMPPASLDFEFHATHELGVILPQLAGFVLMQGHWWVKNVVYHARGEQRAIRETYAFYTELYIFMLFHGLFYLTSGTQCYMDKRSFEQCWFPWFTAVCFWGPLFPLIVMGRQWWFGVFTRRFNCDPARYLKDAAFIAHLLDCVRVQSGDAWWCLRKRKNNDYPWADPRHHFRLGMVTAVRGQSFVVHFGAENDDETPWEKVFRLAGRNTPMHELICMAEEQMRVLDWDSLTFQLLASGPICGASDPSLAANEFLRSSRPLRKGETIDYFVSHSWHDDPVKKYEALNEVALKFKRRHGRFPTFWLDKTCLDQTMIADGLRVLPLTVMSCRTLLMLYTPMYASRLWCMFELFTIMAFFPVEQALQKIEPVTLVTALTCDSVYKELCTFQACNATCFDPNDEARLRKVIAAVGEDSFNDRIQQLGQMCKQEETSNYFTIFKSMKEPQAREPLSVACTLVTEPTETTRDNTPFAEQISDLTAQEFSINAVNSRMETGSSNTLVQSSHNQSAAISIDRSSTVASRPGAGGAEHLQRNAAGVEHVQLFNL